MIELTPIDTEPVGGPNDLLEFFHDHRGKVYRCRNCLDEFAWGDWCPCMAEAEMLGEPGIWF